MKFTPVVFLYSTHRIPDHVLFVELGFSFARFVIRGFEIALGNMDMALHRKSSPSF